MVKAQVEVTSTIVLKTPSLLRGLGTRAKAADEDAVVLLHVAMVMGAAIFGARVNARARSRAHEVRFWFSRF